MKAGFLYFKLQCKRYSRILPVILAESLLLAAFIVMLGSVSMKVMGESTAFAQIEVGVVSQEDDALTGLLVSFVEGMDSFEESCSFTLMDEHKAYEALERGEIYAAVFLPEGVLESILNGTNIPAKIVLSRACSELETAVFKEVADAGGRLLSIAQAGIYAADALCVELECRELIPQTENYLNEAYLEYALNREKIFELEEVSATGKVGIFTYYGISLLLIFLSFTAVVVGRYAKVKKDAHTMIVATLGMGLRKQYLCDTLAYTLTITFAGSFIACPILWKCASYEGLESKTFILCMVFVSILFSVALLVRLLLQISGNGNGGIGGIFAVLLIMMLFCGLILPTAFLPVSLERVGNFLPYRYWMDMILSAMQGRVKIVQLFALVFGDVIMLLLGMGLFGVESSFAGKERKE